MKYLYLIIIVLLVYYNVNLFNYNRNTRESYNNLEILRSDFEHIKLNDNIYLELVILYYQISIILMINIQNKSKWDQLHSLSQRSLAENKHDLVILKQIFENLPEIKQSLQHTPSSGDYINTIMDKVKPNKLNCECKGLKVGINPNKKLEDLPNTIAKLDDNSYIDYMINHNQELINLSKNILKLTNNDYIINYAYKVIRTHQRDSLALNNLKNSSNFKFISDLLIN